MQQYDPKPLPYTLSLEGISDKTMEIHHDKLYVGYVKKMLEIGGELAKFVSGEKEIKGNQTYSELRALRQGETFAKNGVYLHEYYFSVLGGNGEAGEGKLVSAINETYGSLDRFKEYFSASAMAARGWVVLAWDVQQKRLTVVGCDAHNQGGIWGCLPVLVLDVYEHAYYLDYGSNRSAYVEDFWKNLDWAAAEKHFARWTGSDNS